MENLEEKLLTGTTLSKMDMETVLKDLFKREIVIVLDDKLRSQKKDSSKKRANKENEHIMHKSDLDLISLDENWKFKCDICSKRLKNRITFQCHMRLHNKRYICDLCNKKYSALHLLDQHLKIHANEKNYKCPQCPAAFNVKGGLYLHMQVHNKTAQYQCKICTKKYTRKSYLKQHVNTHTNEYNYKCDLCEKKFKTRPQLSSHVKRRHKIREKHYQGSH